MSEKNLNWKNKEGPWQNEPDELRFEDEVTGLDIYIKRHSYFGNLLGYVEIPEAYFLYKKEYDDTDFPLFKVHWGITFSNFMEDGKYYIGFDAAHYDDYMPGIDNFPSITKYKDINFMKKECLSLALQIEFFEINKEKMKIDDNSY